MHRTADFSRCRILRRGFTGALPARPSEGASATAFFCPTAICWATIGSWSLAGCPLTRRVNGNTDIQNLLSEHYFEAFGYPSLPLTFRSGLKFNFGGEPWRLL